MNKVQQTELQARGCVIEKMSKLLRPLYMLVKGLGHMTDGMSKEYDDLVRQVKAPCSVSFYEEGIDSGVSSGESLTTVVSEIEEVISTKRKLVESVESSTSSLDKTFTLPSAKTKGSLIRAEQLMAKGGLLHEYVSVIAEEILQCMFTTCVVFMKKK